MRHVPFDRIWYNQGLFLVGLLLWLCLAQPVQAQKSPDDPTPTPRSPSIHTVQPGETLAQIAQAYHVSIATIQAANGIIGESGITVGQRLLIPGTDTSFAPSDTSRIVVQASDTLTSLALSYGLEPDRLARANRIVNPSLLYIGQAISLPASDSPYSTLMSALVRLDADNSLWKVALRFNVNIRALMISNFIDSPYVVEYGRIIAIPEGSEQRQTLPEPWTAFELHPLPLEQGRAGSINVRTSIPGSVHAFLMSQEYILVSEDGLDHVAVIGIHRMTAPGVYPLTLVMEDATGGVWTYTKNVLIDDGGYGSEEVWVRGSAATILTDAQLIQEEYLYIAQIMSGFTPIRRWNGLFLLPTSGSLSSAFGTNRSYNGGSYDTFHSGADFVAPSGTPIYAPA